MRVEITPAVGIDIREIMKRTTYPNRENDLRRFLKSSSQSWVGRIDGEVACVWGLMFPTILSDTAYLWLLTTNTIERHKFMFIRHSQLVVESMLRDFPLIKGHVLAGQEHSIRWLRWLGCVMVDQHSGLIEFELRRHG